ncbi:MAG: CBS domain-containing protein [Pseudomonadales bacterium]
MGVANSDELTSRLTVEDAYIGQPCVVDIDTPLTEVLATMARRHIGAALITTQERLSGIFTAHDACRVLAERLDTEFATHS